MSLGEWCIVETNITRSFKLIFLLTVLLQFVLILSALFDFYCEIFCLISCRISQPLVTVEVHVTFFRYSPFSGFFYPPSLRRL